MHLLNKLILAAAITFIAGCGGGGDSSGSTALCADGSTTESAGKQGACSHHGGLANTTPNPGSNGTPAPPPNNNSVTPPAKTIIYRGFVKPAISGLTYTNNALQIASAQTDQNGKFPVTEGGNRLISFSVGGIVVYKLSEFNASAFTLANLYQLTLFLNSGITSDVSVQNLGAFLMAIDDDGDTSNGIQITEATRSAAAIMSVNFNQSSAAFYSDPNVLFVISTLSGTTTYGTRNLPTVSQVIAVIN